MGYFRALLRSFRRGVSSNESEILRAVQQKPGPSSGLGLKNSASASWIAPTFGRFCNTGQATQSGRGLPQSKTSRAFQAAFKGMAPVVFIAL
jgi:hypothetical protein